ncbi:MAG: ATP-dependent sacrificial sulfur transferase LarE [Candidatus Altiarchaeota archaeon]
MPEDLKAKKQRLSDFFKGLDGVIIAFSGGVDSSLLAKVSHDTLGEKAIAVTLVSPTSDPSEVGSAGEIAGVIGINHILCPHNELASEGFKSNPEDRCYYCKHELALKMRKIAAEYGVKTIVEGTNASEIRGHRPGYMALREMGILSPLAELGFTKDDVRALSESLRLPNHDKPSTACLASRIPYGTEITGELLSTVSDAESVVRSLGVRQVRVRCLGDVAVIEVDPGEFDKVYDNRDIISDRLLGLGFNRVTMDLKGYRTGSMNYS